MQIEFEPEYHVNFGNPDIDEKPPMSLEEMLQKVKPFVVAYEGIQNQEEWEVISSIGFYVYSRKCLCLYYTRTARLHTHCFCCHLN
jgi:hypothetical protein